MPSSGFDTLRLLAIPIGCLCLSGCDVLRLLLSHRVTTAEAMQAMQRCHVPPGSISWRVTDDGAFAFGKKSPYAPAIPRAQGDCLVEWAKDQRVEVRFIEWEINDP